MSTPVFLPFAVGSVLPADSRIGRADLGRIYQTGNALYQVVRNAAALLTAPASFILVWDDRDAFTVTTTTTANDNDVAGFVPAEVAGNIAGGEYFLLRLPALGGPFVAIASAIVAAPASDGFTVATSVVAGRALIGANVNKTTATVGKVASGGAAAAGGDPIDIVLNF